MAAANRVCKNPRCPCDNPQPLENFGWSNKAKGYRRGKCKVCYNAASNQYKANNREAQQAYQHQYRQDHLEQERARGRQYYADNRDTIRAQQSTPEARARQQQYREENHEAILAQQRTPEARALRRASENARNATEEGKLLNAASNLHYEFYKRKLKEGVRLARAEALIGCTCEQYRDYLASKFKAGMTHDNYGQGTDKWQIDHIIPKAAFKGEINDANLEILFWWGNVQPLWEPENKAKGDYYTEEGKSNLIVRYNAWVAAGRPAP